MCASSIPEVVFSAVGFQPDRSDRMILSGVDVALAQRRVAIIGLNGGGKSTFVRMINGLLEPTCGTVRVDGLDPVKQGKQVRRRVGFVFADADNQIIMPTVREDVEFSLRRDVKNKEERRRAAAGVLDRFGLGELAKRSPHVLSGGQKQLLALASVCVMQPQLIIADEPTTLLDLRNRMMLREVFQGIEQSMYVVTHDLDFVSDFDRALCIDQGSIVADGEPRDVIDFYTRRVV